MGGAWSGVDVDGKGKLDPITRPGCRWIGKASMDQNAVILASATHQPNSRNEKVTRTNVVMACLIR